MNAMQHAHRAAADLDRLSDDCTLTPEQHDAEARALRDEMTAWSMLALAENVRDLTDTMKRIGGRL